MKTFSYAAAAVILLNTLSLTIALPQSDTTTSTYTTRGCWDATLSRTSTVPPPTPTGLVAPTWSQCGGILWQGPTRCAPGNICFKHNDYYSQCIPDPNPTTTATTTRGQTCP